MREFANKYFDLLNDKYSGINLTRINTREEFWSKQIQDSIQPALQSEVFNKTILNHKLHIDVGFGGGFPLLPLAYKYPEVTFFGFEARAKKANVVNEITGELDLNNVKCFHQRIEDLAIDLPCSMSLKAVGKVGDFLSKINTEEIIQVFFYKGPNFYTLEKNQLEQVKKSWKLIEEKEIDVQDVEKRYIIGFENKKSPTGFIKKPKKLSNFSL